MNTAASAMLRSNAVFSDCGRYRYWLERVWDLEAPILPWVLLNGSTAGSVRNDPTVRRVIGFTRQWEFGGLWLVNAYAAMATNPRDLLAMDHNADARNRHYILRTIRNAWRYARGLRDTQELPVIVGWGNHGAYRGQDRRVLAWIGRARVPVRLQCLGVTKRGCPPAPVVLRRGHRTRRLLRPANASTDLTTPGRTHWKSRPEPVPLRFPART